MAKARAKKKDTPIRKTIDFSPILYKRILAHAHKRGCQSCGETVRDLVRIGLSSTPYRQRK